MSLDWRGVEAGVEPARHGWGLGGGQVQQVGDKDGLSRLSTIRDRHRAK